MKISKATRWILTIGIVAILLVGLGVIYSRHKVEQSELAANIAQARQDFTKYTTQKKDLEASLSKAKSRIATAEGKFHKSIESIEITTVLFEAADDANVTITELTSSLPEEEVIRTEEVKGSSKEEGVTFRVFSIKVTAEGEVVALLNFSRKVSENFDDYSIESVEIEVPQVEEEGEGGGEEPGKPSITLSFKIYAYEGD